MPNIDYLRGSCIDEIFMKDTELFSKLMEQNMLNYHRQKQGDISPLTQKPKVDVEIVLTIHYLCSSCIDYFQNFWNSI